MQTSRLSKDENVARGYAVYNPHGEYRKPNAMTSAMKAYVDSGHVKVSEWGKIVFTDKWDNEIKNLAKPELKPLSTGSGFDRMLDSLEVDDINFFKTQMISRFPELTSPVAFLLEDKPTELVAMEKTLQAKLDAYWTPERKAIAKANQDAVYTYELAKIRIESAKSDAQKIIDKADSFLQNAIECKKNPELAKTQRKIAAIIEDKKRSSSEKVTAVFEQDKSAGASHTAKRDIVVAIASLLGKGLTKEAIFLTIQDMPEFSALAYKRPEKEFNRIFNDTTTWIHYKNQIKVFYDLLGWVTVGLANKKIQKDTKNQLPGIFTMIALHQAKDNDSRGLVAFRYLTRITVVSSPLLSLDHTKIGRKLEKYSEYNYINYAKGVQGGISSRAGLMPYQSELSVEDANKAVETILASFEGSPFYTELETVLNLITRNDVVSSPLLTPPDYNNQDLENAVDALLAIFVPLTRAAADERIAERQIESVDFEAAKETYLAEQEEKIKAHLESGLGFQPRRKVSVALSD